MKKLFLCLAGAAMALTLNAKVWRVNYDENAKADFKTIKEACATTLVSDGDTLYMEPGLHNGSSTDNTISRPLTILGPGWGFQANEGAISALPTTNFSNTITLRSSDVTILGLYIQTGIEYQGSFWNIRIERCKLSSFTPCSSYTLQNLVFRNNYFSGSLDLTYLWDNVRYCVIENNIIRGKIDINGTGQVDLYNVVRHNIILGGITIGKGGQLIVCDNILLSASPFDFKTTYPNVQIYNNVLGISQEQYDADLISVSPVGYSNFSNNIFAGATVENTFVNQTEGIYFDEAMKYQVRSDSPAKNAATDGTDCGAFGGEHPFVLYGRPEGIPYIYDVEVPAYPTDNKLNISFKVAGQNE